MKMTGNTILITGGGSGIGRALAHRLHDLGNRVIVAGRRQAALDETAAGRDGISTMVLDAERADGIADFAGRLTAEHPALNVLVNNAGVMMLEKAGGKRDLADAEAMVATNLLGPIRLTDALVDHLKRQADAAIVNVTSGLAFVPLLAAPTYSATKAALHSYTVSLRAILKGEVEVIELAPPGVQTDLTPGQASRPGYLPLDDFIDEVITLWSQEPTPGEILVERVRPARRAEASGRYDEALVQLNAMAEKARAAQG